MMISIGNNDRSNRSDCYIEVENKKSGGIKLFHESKVDIMYGNQNKDLILQICKEFDFRHGIIRINDFGALPFTIAARFEALLKRLNPQLKGEFLFPILKQNKAGTSKDKLRRSRLYLPGNSPKLFMNAGLHNPDGIILDLEDSVSPNEKDAAQLLVRNALRSVDFYGCERMVRINQLQNGLDDLECILPHYPNVILVPKVESEIDIWAIDEKIEEYKKSGKLINEVFLMPIIESALGVMNAHEIAHASNRNCALAIGLEDYTADIGVERTNDGKESFYARSVIVNAAKSAGIQPIDTVFSDVSDMEGLYNSVIEAKSLGFEGKGCIHPRQIKVVHSAFSPSDAEIDKANKIVDAYNEAKKNGLGVVSLGTKMIDAPVVKRAQNVLKMVNKSN